MQRATPSTAVHTVVGRQSTVRREINARCMADILDQATIERGSWMVGGCLGDPARISGPRGDICFSHLAPTQRLQHSLSFPSWLAEVPQAMARGYELLDFG